jgi:hypothetical protein
MPIILNNFDFGGEGARLRLNNAGCVSSGTPTTFWEIIPELQNSALKYATTFPPPPKKKNSVQSSKFTEWCLPFKTVDANKL